MERERDLQGLVGAVIGTHSQEENGSMYPEFRSMISTELHKLTKLAAPPDAPTTHAKSRSVSLLLTRTAFVVPENGCNGLKHESPPVKPITSRCCLGYCSSARKSTIISWASVPGWRYRETLAPLTHPVSEYGTQWVRILRGAVPPG
jgi:hypothetical protein